MKTTFRIKNKTTMFVTTTNKHDKTTRTEYKGYVVGDLPNSFGYKYKFNGYDDDGDKIYKEGKYQWFKFRGLTWLVAPPKTF